MLLVATTALRCFKGRETQHVLAAARLLSKLGNDSKSTDNKSSSSGSNSHSNTCRFYTRRPSRRPAAAREQSKSLTEHLGKLGRQGYWQDALRALEAAEAQGQVIDVYNFSAAIAALVRCKQPNRAVQLSPLMQQRGVQPNVFTYTALIDAHSKSGQWQTALELLNEMKRQDASARTDSKREQLRSSNRCLQQKWAVAESFRTSERDAAARGAPNVSSYTAAIDACSKGEQWQIAEGLLHEMHQRAFMPNERTYTALIDAYSKSGLWQPAIELLREMKRQNVEPTIESYTAAVNACTVIDAYSKAGLWQQAIELLREMAQKSIKLTVESYNSAINACSKGGQWQQAVDLLREIQQQGLRPDVTSYSSTIDACSGSGPWQQAIDLLREMQQQQLLPDILTYDRAINACQKGGNWQLTINLLQELKAAGLTPNEITYGCVIDALHVADQYAKAEELYLEMFGQGLIRSHWSIRDLGKLDFHDFTEGMAAAAMRIVLRDIAIHNATARKEFNSSASLSYVHPIGNDLHIITGHAMHREDRDGSVLQPLVMSILKQLHVECCINARNKGMVTVKSSALVQYAARVAAEQ
eukprot:11765-Heterococcus_DN1.PRE.1